MESILSLSLHPNVPLSSIMSACVVAIFFALDFGEKIALLCCRWGCGGPMSCFRRAGRREASSSLRRRWVVAAGGGADD